MIKLTSFYPFKGLQRDTQEFHEHGFIVKTKSLTFEREEEFGYSKIRQVSDWFNASGSQVNFGAWTVMATAFIMFVFRAPLSENTVFLRVAQSLFVIGLIINITGHYKHRHIFLSDENDNNLTTMKVTRKNRETVSRVLEMIRNNSNGIQFITTADPFPETKPAFEYSYFDYANLRKSTDKFFEDKIIGFEKNLLIETAHIVNYKSLTRKLFRGKLGISIGGAAFSFTIFMTSLLAGLHWGFNLHFHQYIWNLFLVLFGLSLISLLLSFVKMDIVGFYNKNGRVIYWAYVSQKNKEKFEKIIEFVQSRIPAENKEAPPKEQA